MFFKLPSAAFLLLFLEQVAAVVITFGGVAEIGTPTTELSYTFNFSPTLGTGEFGRVTYFEGACTTSTSVTVPGLTTDATNAETSAGATTAVLANLVADIALEYTDVGVSPDSRYEYCVRYSVYDDGADDIPDNVDDVLLDYLEVDVAFDADIVGAVTIASGITATAQMPESVSEDETYTVTMYHCEDDLESPVDDSSPPPVLEGEMFNICFASDDPTGAITGTSFTDPAKIDGILEVICTADLPSAADKLFTFVTNNVANPASTTPSNGAPSTFPVTTSISCTGLSEACSITTELPADFYLDGTGGTAIATGSTVSCTGLVDLVIPPNTRVRARALMQQFDREVDLQNPLVAGLSPPDEGGEPGCDCGLFPTTWGCCASNWLNSLLNFVANLFK